MKLTIKQEEEYQKTLDVLIAWYREKLETKMENVSFEGGNN